jgi:hypothetical protein
MQSVVSSFDMVVGPGAAKPFFFENTTGALSYIKREKDEIQPRGTNKLNRIGPAQHNTKQSPECPWQLQVGRLLTGDP